MIKAIYRGTFLTTVLFMIVCASSVYSDASSAGSGVKVIFCTRDVEVTPPGGVTVDCRRDMVLTSGSRVKTAEKASVSVHLVDEPMNMVRIGPGSDVLLDLSGDKAGIQLIDGEMIVLLRGEEKGERFRVVTPAAVCGARGTGWSVGSREGSTEVIVFEGSVYVKGISERGIMGEDGTVYLEKGYKSVITAGERPGYPRKADKEVLSGLKDEMSILINSIRSRRGMARRRMRDEKKMQAMENRMDRAIRVNRMSAGPGVAPGPLKGPSSPSSPADEKKD
ncbi:MAG: hypothetical protein GF392_04450 [Candidatus Omnitrophica bacterium]|nr:hypothetical protein [Candidatus Omnitrophota bacterium]